jgi:DNA-binding NarL/FixJ family response regulator
MINTCLIAAPAEPLGLRVEKLLKSHFSGVGTGFVRELGAALRRLQAGWSPRRNAWVIHLDDDPNGMTLVEALHLSNTEHHIMVCTEDRRKALQAFHSGAMVCKLLPCDDSCLLTSLTHLLRGDIFVDVEVIKPVRSGLQADGMVAEFPPINGHLAGRHNGNGNDTLNTEALALLTRLTGRERQILQSLKSGLSTKEIAAQLDISHYTVSTHIKHVYRKLGVNSRSHLRKNY